MPEFRLLIRNLLNRWSFAMHGIDGIASSEITQNTKLQKSVTLGYALFFLIFSEREGRCSQPPFSRFIVFVLRRFGSGLLCFVFEHLNFGLCLPLQCVASVFCVL